MFSTALVVLALSSSAFATVFVTNPVSSTTFVGGQPCTVSWQDDGTQPTTQAFGAAIVSIYAGNSQQQTNLQTITPNVNVGTTSSIVFTPDPSIGPNADQYFIRFESLALKDTTNPLYPALSFSAKFTMSGMTGTFNASVQAQIDGQSTAPIGGTAAPAASASPAASLAASTTPAMVTTTPKSSSAAASKTSGSSAAASTNGAGKVAGAGVAAFAGVAIAVLSGAFC